MLLLKLSQLFVVSMNTKISGAQGKILDLKREPTNTKNVLAVCIQKGNTVAGPCNLVPLVSYFLEKPLNTDSVEITGAPLNFIAGMGMEVPCIYIYRLVAPKMYAKG